MTQFILHYRLIINLIITTILARLLEPNDFGVVSIALIVINFFAVFSDMGLAPAIIQRKDLNEQDLSILFSFTIVLGVFMAFIFYLIAPYISLYYDNELLTPVCQLLAINVFFASANIVPNGLILKNKRFRFMAVRTLFVQLLCGIVSCILAFNSAGIYSLLLTPITSSVFIFFINYKQHRLNFSFTINKSTFSKIASYSMFQLLFNISSYVVCNLDKFIIGKRLGMSQLGFYDKSYQLIQLPIVTTANVLIPVLHPLLSNYQHDNEKVLHYNDQIVKVLAFIGFTLSVFFYFSSREIIILLFGYQWIEAIPVFKILSLSIGWQTIMSSCNAFFQAANSTKYLFVAGIYNSIIIIISLVVSVIFYSSVESLAWAWVISRILNLINTYWFLNVKVLKGKYSCFIKQLYKPILSSIFISIILWVLDMYTSNYRLIISFLLKSLLILLFIIIIYFNLHKNEAINE